MHHLQSLPEKAVVVYSFEHICSAVSTLHNFNVVDICLTAEQIEGDQGALTHCTSLVHYTLEPITI